MKEKAIIVDLDGTISFLNGRNPFKYHLSGEDLPNDKMIKTMQEYKSSNHIIIILSGRGDSSRVVTEQWLKEHNVPYDHLYMKPDHDQRKSRYYKEEILTGEILPRYDIIYSFDDYHKNLIMFRQYNIATALVSEKTGDISYEGSGQNTSNT